jgi:hypothetical protein
MTTFLMSNNAASNLAAPISNTALSVTLTAGTGAEFPNPSGGQQFPITFNDAATGLLVEIVYCTARVGDTLTIVRAQEGTVAQNWLAGDLAANLITAGILAAYQQSAALQPARTAQTGGAGGVFAMTTADNGGVVALNRTSPVSSPVSTTLPTSPNGATYKIADLGNNFQLYPVTVNFPAGTTGPNGLTPATLDQSGQVAEFTFVSDSNEWTFKR